MVSGVKQEARCHQTCGPRTVFNRRCGDGVVCTSFVHTRHRTDLPSASKPPTRAICNLVRKSVSTKIWLFRHCKKWGPFRHLEPQRSEADLLAKKSVAASERPLAWNALRSYFAAPVTQNKFRHVVILGGLGIQKHILSRATFCEAVTIMSMWNPATLRSHQFCLRNRMFT